MGESLREYCAHYDRGELLEQWHDDRIGALTRLPKCRILGIKARNQLVKSSLF